LDSPFGIDAKTADMDEFLSSKIRKKLFYWTNVHLSLAGRAVVVNFVLLSMLWYFITIWGGTLATICKLCDSMRDFLWYGSANRSQARVSWFDCCASRYVGGLNLVDPKEALYALMTKWILKVMLPRSSNLQFLL